LLHLIWDTRNYFFWLLAVSLLCWVLERVTPWREQRAWRDQIGQDFFWLVFNGHYAGVLIAHMTALLIARIGIAIGGWPLPSPEAVHLLAGQPPWAQFIVFLVAKDVVEYGVHRLLHGVPWLWEFHKLHHSIKELDWIGNMRFHWMEIVVYKGLTYLPLVLLGVEGRVILWVAVVGTLIGHINHSNLNFGWGALRKVINSPRFHVWHHDVVAHGKAAGQNFGILFCAWDWLFGTAYRPEEDQPPELGFTGMERFPTGLLGRFLYPFWKRRRSERDL
jgi:sterol desaturase/sphingolipid hydroxylase (fatty acid hydroxylase superfamily)